LLGGDQVQAAPAPTVQDTAQIDVDVNVDSNCEVTASPLSFPTYDPGAAGATVATTPGVIMVNCTDNVVFHVGVDLGATVTGGVTDADGALAMLDDDTGTYTLGYDIAVGAGLPIAVASATNVESNGLGDGYDSGNPGDQTYTINGSIAPLQGVPGGDYSDQITVSLSY
jgi:spore coat protein U-like protein